MTFIQPGLFAPVSGFAREDLASLILHYEPMHIASTSRFAYDRVIDIQQSMKKLDV